MKDYAPSAERNRDDILAALRELLPPRGRIVEVASGTGQHAAHFAPHVPEATWQPTERRVEMFPSIRAWAAEAGAANVLDPIELDVTWPTWPVAEADALVNINMWHITPWSTCVALLQGAARVLTPGGLLYYYGAVFRPDREPAPSNLAFDASLRERNPEWGVRHLDAVTEAAATVGLVVERVIDMPRNNTSLVLRRAPRP